MSLINNTNEKIIKRIAIICLILIGIFFIFLDNPIKYAYGLVFGATINILNFRLMSLTVAKSVRMPSHKVMPYVVGNYMIRYMIYGIVLTISVKADYLSFFTVILGFFMVKIVILTDTFYDMIRKKSTHD